MVSRTDDRARVQRGNQRRMLAASAVALLSVALPAAAQITDPNRASASGTGTGSGTGSDQDTTPGRTGTSGTTDSNTGTTTAARSQPIDVNDRSAEGQDSNLARALTRNANTQTARDGVTPTIKRPAPPSALELFVADRIGRPLPRFGRDLIIAADRDFAAPPVSAVPPTYVIQPGDEVFIGLAGSLDGSIRAEVDSSGRVFIPKVGFVKLAGLRFGELQAVLTRAIGSQYRGFKVAVSMEKLRGFRVYVTGFANNPGGYSVNSLSTLVNAVLAAGGPSAGGSFRSIKLFRGNVLVSDFDFYAFIRDGDKSKDVLLESGDVLYIAPVGAQVAVAGSVNQEAIYEARRGETIGDVLHYAGGLDALADQARVIQYHLADRDSVGGVEVPRGAFAATPVDPGDIVEVLANGSLAQPLSHQSTLVRVDGEVNRPGNYFVKPGTNLDAVIALAGGLAPDAFVFGTRLQRLSVQQQQRVSFEEALNQLEISLAAAPLTTSLNNPNGAEQLTAARATLTRLRAAQPDGRVVLPLADPSAPLPGYLTLENSDRINIPTRPTTVGVFGAVYRPASFLLEPGRPKKVADYLNMAGGTLRAADRGQLFLVRANGAVLSKKRGALEARVLPGDIVFVPIRTQNNSLLNKLGQIGSLIFGLGLSAASIAAITR